MSLYGFNDDKSKTKIGIETRVFKGSDYSGINEMMLAIYNYAGNDIMKAVLYNKGRFLAYPAQITFFEFNNVIDMSLSAKRINGEYMTRIEWHTIYNNDSTFTDSDFNSYDIHFVTSDTYQNVTGKVSSNNESALPYYEIYVTKILK